jgi:hypothetical protein
MMGDATALKVAIDLVHVPSRVRVIRSNPLPEGVLMLLRIAAGDEAAECEAAELTGRSRDVVRKAAAFFIEQILLYPEADSYRVLGASPQAPSRELRRHMALLLRWLHPDMDRQGERSLFAGRVIRAWEDLKTPARRAAYDEARRTLHAKESLLRNERDARARSGNPASKKLLNNGAPSEQSGKPSRSLDIFRVEGTGLLRRALLLLLGRARH